MTTTRRSATDRGDDAHDGDRREHRDRRDDGWGDRGREPGRFVERDQSDEWPGHDEQEDPARDTGDRGQERFDGSESGHLQGRGADKPKRGEPLFATSRRKSRGGRHEDRDGGQGPDDREDDQEDHARVNLGGRWVGLERLYRRRTELGHGRRRLPDDRDQLLRRTERRVIDGAHDRPEPIAELVRRDRGDPGGQRRRDERLARGRESVDPGWHRRFGDKRRKEHADHGLALVDVPGRGHQEGRTVGGASLRQQDVRPPRAPLGSIVEGGTE